MSPDTTDSNPRIDQTNGEGVSMRQKRVEQSPNALRAFRVAYDGRGFHGFQRQPDVSTIEGVLFAALEELGVFEPDSAGPSRPPGYAAAGRTDAGVSAVAQTVAFACPDWLTPQAFNSELPASVRIWASAEVASDFHATHDASGREYSYCLYAPAEDARSRAGADSAREPISHRPQIDDGRVQTALATLSGYHDFHNLTPNSEGTVRDLTATAQREGAFLLIRVAAGGFPREFVRRLVGLLREVGTGSADQAFVERALEPTPLEGPDGIGPAPAAPLVLTDVDYPDCRFEPDEEAVERVKTIFGDRQATARANARVAGLIWQMVSEG